MQERDLKGIKTIQLEIQRLERVLHELKNSNNNSDLKCDYIRLLQEEQDKLYKKKIEAEQFIMNIDDAEIRLILTLKFIDLRSWNYISRKLHYDRSTVYKKYKTFLNQHSQKTTF